MSALAKGNRAMSDRKYSARTAFSLVLAAIILCGIALPAFGQQNPAPPPDTQDTPGAVQPAGNPKEDCGKPGVICDRLEVPAQESPKNLSPRDPIAPRTAVDTLAEVKKNGKLRVGVSMIVPWSMHDKDGNLIGFEIDIARKMARDLGVDVEFYPEEFRYLIPDLRDSRFDVIISGMSITTNRAMQANFSAPYNYVDLTLVANKQLAGNFKSLADFDKPNVTIGVLDTSTAVDIASNKFPNANLRTYAESADIFTDLLDGKLYGAVADSPRPEVIAKLYPDNIYLPETKPLATFPAAFAVRRGDPDFLAYLNAWIEARTVNKWLERRRNYWFRTTEWEKRL
jgi:polar amino acid transport system substrate-binding protein